MQSVETLIQKENDGTISFGNYTLAEKAKRSDFEHNGDLYKVKTFQEITKLEKNGMFVYESVPGTTVSNLSVTGTMITFGVEGAQDAQITLELEAEKLYDVFIDNNEVGAVMTNFGGKLSFNAELNGKEVNVKITKR